MKCIPIGGIKTVIIGRGEDISIFKNDMSLHNYMVVENTLAAIKIKLKEKRITFFRALCNVLNRNIPSYL